MATIVATDDDFRDDDADDVHKPLLMDGDEQGVGKGAAASSHGTVPLLQGEVEDGSLPIGPTVRELLRLSLPIFVSRVSWTGMKVTDQALLGHVSADALSAASLSDMYTSCSGVFIQGRVLSVFAGQAIGAGNPTVAGQYFQVAALVGAIIALPVLALWAVTGPVLGAFRESHQLIHLAWYYALVLMAAIPARIIASQLSQLFSARKVMHPSMIAGVVAVLLNVMLGLPLVLGIPIPGFAGFGFTPCPIITASMEWLQILIVVVFFRHHLQPLWPSDGFSLAHITKQRVIAYLKLYVPAAVSLGSDFWRLSVIGFVAASIGDTEVATFSSSYRILWIALLWSGSIAASTGILLNLAFGRGQHRNARKIAILGMSIVLVLLVVIATVVLLFCRDLGHIFSSDPVILDEFHNIRLPLALTVVGMNLAVASEAVLIAMGRTKVVLGVGIIGSWGLQVPLTFLFVKVWKGPPPLFRLYMAVAVGYLGVSLLMLIILARSDFARYADEARERAEVAPLPTQLDDEPKAHIKGPIN